jgi:alpha-L-rhamnosidase
MKSVLILLTFAAGSFAAVAMQPGSLRCEYRANPQGIDVTAPRLSWMLTGGDPKARGLRQTAYRVLASSSESALKSNTGDLWDTGKVISDQSIQVVYAGKPLASSAVAFWKVQVWDQDGKPTDWSAPAQWSMGLLHAADWQAKWIGRDEPGIYQDPASRYQVLRSAHWIWDGPTRKPPRPRATGISAARSPFPPAAKSHTRS